jgi:molecular chaperone GrpE
VNHPERPARHGVPETTAGTGSPATSGGGPAGATSGAARRAAGAVPDGGEVPGGEAVPGDAAVPGGAVRDIEQRWRRALDDLDSLRRRYDRQAARDQATERCRVVAAWLPVVDNLDLALAHAGGGEGGVVEGVRAIRDQAVAVLSALGYPRHDEVGVPFDPVTHEAISVECPDGQPSGVVLRVLRPGYGDGDRQLRPASVVVSGEAG